MIKATVGVDWGTHSSKWIWAVEDNGIIELGPFRILRSDLILENGTMLMQEVPPPYGALFKSSLKRRLIQSPDASFWEGKLADTSTSLGEFVSYSLWYLAEEACGDVTRQLGVAPDEIEIRFSLPNWVEGRDGSQARARYEQAAKVACKIMAFRIPWSASAMDCSAWHELVERARTDLRISDNTPPIDYADDGFRKVLAFRHDIDGRISFRFVAESSAAGLAGLRKNYADAPGYLRKLLVVDIGAGSADIGYLVRSLNDKRQECLSQLPPAGTCETAGDDLTKRIVAISRSQGKPITQDEAEALKVGGAQSWQSHPSVIEWIERIANHVREYVKNLPDESWLPFEPHLELLVTGGSALVPGVVDELVRAAKAALVSRFPKGQVISINLVVPSPYALDANRLAVAFGCSSEELPKLTYFSSLPRRIERATVKAAGSFAG